MGGVISFAHLTVCDVHSFLGGGKEHDLFALLFLSDLIGHYSHHTGDRCKCTRAISKLNFIPPKAQNIHVHTLQWSIKYLVPADLGLCYISKLCQLNLASPINCGGGRKMQAEKYWDKFRLITWITLIIEPITVKVTGCSFTCVDESLLTFIGCDAANISLLLLFMCKMLFGGGGGGGILPLRSRCLHARVMEPPFLDLRMRRQFELHIHAKPGETTSKCQYN